MRLRLNTTPYDRHCPSWTVLVIGALGNGPLRCTPVASCIDGVLQKVLTQTLRPLGHKGLVTRAQHPEILPRVEYELTEVGPRLRAPLQPLEDWAKNLMPAILEADEGADTGAGR